MNSVIYLLLQSQMLYCHIMVSINKWLFLGYSNGDKRNAGFSTKYSMITKQFIIRH